MNGHKRQPLFGANADWLANLPAEMHARRVLRELRFDLRQSPCGRGNACALAHVVAPARPASNATRLMRPRLHTCRKASGPSSTKRLAILTGEGDQRHLKNDLLLSPIFLQPFRNRLLSELVGRPFLIQCSTLELSDDVRFPLTVLSLRSSASGRSPRGSPRPFAKPKIAGITTSVSSVD